MKKPLFTALATNSEMAKGETSKDLPNKSDLTNKLLKNGCKALQTEWVTEHALCDPVENQDSNDSKGVRMDWSFAKIPAQLDTARLCMNLRELCISSLRGMAGIVSSSSSKAKEGSKII